MKNDKATTIKLFKMLMEWRKTKSLALAYDICETVVTQDGTLSEKEIDYIENEWNQTQ